ncbi:MAG: hypothetical protein Terrestrivirus5_146 [Terrestrivirus sp.]|uniref:Uncharacterized protein n=1 Tax=Terrestrivirus sp. TaxID=2487775 RepID=A0A3G4ZPP8_9VIRU|nr:MAG: hypothetical protein Terrestrivirus5_146 [Terrestrivirus sp.]
MSANLGDFISEEDLFNEHKEFTFSPDSVSKLGKDDIINYLTGQYDKRFFSIIQKNLVLYIKKYFPKCFSAFVNTEISTKPNLGYDSNNGHEKVPMYGHLNIGVTDSGNISGIPIMDFNKNRDKIINVIRKHIQKLIDDKIIVLMDSDNSEDNSDDNSDDDFSDSTGIQKLCDMVEIEICTLNSYKNDINKESEIIVNDSINFIIRQAKEAEKRNEKEISKYISEKTIYDTELRLWLDRTEKYGCKLDVVLNDIQVRTEFIHFVLSGFPDSVLSENSVTIEQIININGGDCEIRMTNNEYNRIIYIFRDKMRSKLMPEKPIKPKFVKIINPKLCTLMRLTPLIDVYNHNKDITYIFIRLKVPLNNLPNGKIVCYKDKTGIYNVKKRSIKYVNGKFTPENIFV